MEITVSKGLDLPLSSNLEEPIVLLKKATQVAADVSFIDLQTRLLVKIGQQIKKAEPLVQDKLHPAKIFPSPASGKIVDIQRGLKRQLERIVIEIDDQETILHHPFIDLQEASKQEIIDRLLLMGGFFRIHSRPFDGLASPEKLPQHLFIKCFEAAPLSLNLIHQLYGNEELFSYGLQALKKLCPNLHLVTDNEKEISAFTKFANYIVMAGKYPKSSLSLAIDHICPIQKIEDVVWTLNLYDVIVIGSMMQGKLFTEKKVGLFLSDKKKQAYYLARDGVAFKDLNSNIANLEISRIISSHPLMGEEITSEGFLGFNDFQFSILPNDENRPFLHFMRFGSNHYSSANVYLSSKKHFSTNLNGEVRSFLDGSIYQRVMPLNIPVMHLIQALMAKNYEKAIEIGLLEVCAEDFALPSFVCPSKIDMIQIVKQGLINCQNELTG